MDGLREALQRKGNSNTNPPTARASLSRQTPAPPAEEEKEEDAPILSPASVAKAGVKALQDKKLGFLKMKVKLPKKLGPPGDAATRTRH